MKKLPLLFLCLFAHHAIAQTDSLDAVEDALAFQRTLNEQFKNREKSPLTSEAFEIFQGHDFFPVNLDYRVVANLNVTEGTPFFGMRTTTSRISTERIYGYLEFVLLGKQFRLPVYQSRDLMQNAEYADYLFFPFSDETNGKESYTGGRYIELRAPKGGDSTIVVDFNKAYNPYCAYSARFSCPIVPRENNMDIEVRAGVMYTKRELAPSAPSNVEVIVKNEISPEYPGGYEALTKFVLKHLKYPRKAVKQKVQGTVYVQFIVNRDGSVSDVATIRGVSPECDQEAERVVALMPKWKPAMVNGETVAVKYVLPILFGR